MDEETSKKPISNTFILDIHRKNRTMQSLDQSLNIYYLLRETLLLQIPGDVVEIGCYRGLTAVMLQKTLDSFSSQKSLHLYDSFEGLPQKGREDDLENWKGMKKIDYKDNKKIGKGWFSTTESAVLENFSSFNVKTPFIHKGWFEDTLPDHLPKMVSFALLDGDFYESILTSLENLYPKLSKGAIVVIDDYCDSDLEGKQNTFPGVKKACDQFLKGKEEKIVQLASLNEFHGYFIKS